MRVVTLTGVAVLLCVALAGCSDSAKVEPRVDAAAVGDAGVGDSGPVGGLSISRVIVPASKVFPGQQGLEVSLLLSNANDFPLKVVGQELRFARGASSANADFSVRLADDGDSEIDANGEFSLTFLVTVALEAKAGLVDVDASVWAEAPGAVTVLATGAEQSARWEVIRPGETAAVIAMVSGNSQSAVVGTELADLLVVKVTDASGAPVGGARVDFQALQGGATLLADGRQVTGDDGNASIAVRVGTVAGELNQLVRVVLVDDPSQTIQFVATAVAGPADHLSFAVQPGEDAGIGLPFRPQPVVLALDEFDNTTPLTGTVTLSVDQGTGQLTGSTDVEMVAGRVAFSGIAYDAVEAGVVLRATIGSLFVDSHTLDVTALPPGACQKNDDSFTTAGGGCQDLLTGLVWSRRSSTTLTWHRAIWDAKRASSAPSDIHDQGRTNDYPTTSTPCGGHCDADSMGYCHDLVEAGVRDWRMPTKAELVLLFNHLRLGTPPYLHGQTGEWVRSADSYSSDTNRSPLINLSTGLIENNGGKGSAYRVFCVRADRMPGTKLVVVGSKPLAVGVGRTPFVSLRIGIRDANGKQVNRQGGVVTISATSLGTLGGGLTATTDAAGVAWLGSWTLDTVGTATLTITATGLDPVEFTIPVGTFPHSCAVEDGDPVLQTGFTTAQGGCRHELSGLVWSSASTSAMMWHEAIWDSARTGVGPDAHDGTRTNDYGNSPSSWPDASVLNYCHELQEGGFLDWRVPTSEELQTVYSFGQGAPTHFGFSPNMWMHSSISSAAYAIAVNPATGSTTSVGKTDDRYVRAICVRKPAS